jgi:hypothetical protein
VIAADICIYGASPAGVIAAIQAARLNRSVVLLEPGPRVGGMTTSGLGFTDIGNKIAVGGLAREFYRRVGLQYGGDEAWTFEPRAAERTFSDWLREAGVTVHCRQFVGSVERDGLRITALRTIGGLVVRAQVFIDASYEGDLMHLAGCSHVIGREANSAYEETLNGAQIHGTHQFDAQVDPFVTPGIAASGLLPGIDSGTPVIGEGDHRIQAYCFRVCMTDDASNRIPFPRPPNFDPRWYVLLERHFAAGWRDVFSKLRRGSARRHTTRAASSGPRRAGPGGASPTCAYISMCNAGHLESRLPEVVHEERSGGAGEPAVACHEREL